MPERKLPLYVDITGMEGLFTKSSSDAAQPEQLEDCKNFDFFNEYGGATKLRGTRRVLSSTYQEAAVTKELHSVSFYKAIDNNGSQLRHTLIGAGTTIQRVESGGSLTELATGKVERPWLTTQFDRFMLMANQDVHSVGNGNEPLKYDGNSVSNLGVIAPGSNGTVKESFNDSSVFDNLTDITLSDESTVTFDGAATKVIPGTAGTASQFDETYAVFSVSTSTANRVQMYVYIPKGDIEKLSQTEATPAIKIRFESAAADYYEYHFSIGKFVEGWNLLSMSFTAAPSGAVGTSNGTLNTSAINKITWFVNTANAVDQPQLRFDRLIVLNQGAPNTAGDFSTTTVLDYDTTGDFSSSDADGVTGDTTEKKEGTQSIRADKTETDYTEMDVDYTGSALATDFSTAVNDEATIWVYIPTPTNLDANNAVEVWLSEDSGFSTTTDVWTFARPSSAGWTQLTLDLTTPSRQEGAGVDLTAVDYVRVRFRFIGNTVAEDGYRIDALQFITSGGGALTGAHTYRVTYLTKYGTESNAGPISESVTIPTGGGDILLTNIPVSPDSQVVARNIYRTVAGGDEHLYLVTIYDNSTTSYTDQISDGALAITTPPIAGDLILDHSPPLKIGFMKTWKRTVFAAGNPQEPNVLYFSNIDKPEEWPLINAFILDSRITGLFATDRGLIVTTDDAWWWVIGSNPTFTVDKISNDFGAVGPRAVGEMRAIGYAVDKDGIRFYDYNNPVKASEPIRDKYEDLNKTNIEETFTIHSRRYNTFVQANKGSDGEIDSLYQYQYFFDNIMDGVWSLIDIPSETGIKPRDFAEVEDSTGEWHIYMASGDGMLYEILDPDTYVWTHADGSTTNITSTVKTHFLRPTGARNVFLSSISGQGRAIIDYVELRIAGDLSSASTWTVLLEQTEGSYEDGKVISSKTLTFEFDANEHLKRIRPQNLAGWEHLRLTVTNADNANLICRGLRVWYHGTEGPFIV